MLFWYGNDTNVWGYILMGVSMVAFWALIIYWVLAIVRTPARSDPAATALRATPEQVVADRLARGEIDPKQYHALLETLRGGPRMIKS